MDAVDTLIPLFNPDTAPKSVTDFISLIPVDRVVTRVLANSETFFQPVMSLTSACWAPTRTIRSSEWQTCVLRTAALLGCPYEQQVNEPLGGFFGFDDEAIALLRRGDMSSTRFSDRHRLVAQMVDELVQQRRLTPATTAKSNETFGPEGTIEIIVIHNVYALVAHVMRTANVEEDPPIPGVVETLRKFNAKAIEIEMRQREEDQASPTARRFRARAAVEAMNGLTNGVSAQTNGVSAHEDASKPTPVPAATPQRALAFDTTGITNLQADDSGSAGTGPVQVRWLYAPVNPQDRMVVEGKYPLAPTYKTEAGRLIAGYDGVGRVEASEDAAVATGTLVIPATQGVGTWRAQARLPAASLLTLPNQKPTAALSMLRMTYLPAFLLLEKHRLYPGDWIIMNAGTSSIARAVARLAAARGVHVALVVRTSASAEELGASVVLTEAEMAEPEPAALQGKRIVLGLDAVYGASGTHLLRAIEAGGTFVNYGTLGGGGPGAEIAVRSRDLFWKNVAMVNFRSSEEIARLGPERTNDLLRWLAGEIEKGWLSVPVETFAWSGDVVAAVQRAQGPKLVFDMGA